MQFRDEQERLIAEQAVLQYRAVQQAAEEAKWGHGMQAIEDAALDGCRVQARKWIETAMAARAKAEKNTARSARTAASGRTSNGSRRDR